MPNQSQNKDWSKNYGGHFPGSQKVYESKSLTDGTSIEVPKREISLSGKEAPLRVYDTSGPLGIDPRQGLPALRKDWIQKRGDIETCERVISLDPNKTPLFASS